MNKFKFFGCALMAALFAFSFASCEKEDFKTDVDTDVNAPSINIPGVDLPDSYKPGDAVISIQPTVWAVINGEIQNVTALSTLKFNDVEMDSYTKTSATGFAAMTVKIAASYEATVGEEKKTLSAETTIEVPALTAGQVAIFTPTLVMSAKSEGESDEPGGDTPGGDEPGGDTPGGTTPGGSTSSALVKETEIGSFTKSYDFHYENPKNYYYDQYELGNAVVIASDVTNYNYGSWESELKKYVNKYDNQSEILNFGKHLLYANSITCVKVDVTYKNWKVTAETRSSEAFVEYYVKESAIYNFTYGLALENGKGHSHSNTSHSHGHGNGHSHGHGIDNAGGGIVSPL